MHKLITIHAKVKKEMWKLSLTFKSCNLILNNIAVKKILRQSTTIYNNNILTMALMQSSKLSVDRSRREVSQTSTDKPSLDTCSNGTGSS